MMLRATLLVLLGAIGASAEEMVRYGFDGTIHGFWIVTLTPDNRMQVQRKDGAAPEQRDGFTLKGGSYEALVALAQDAIETAPQDDPEAVACIDYGRDFIEVRRGGEAMVWEGRCAEHPVVAAQEALDAAVREVME